MAAKKAEAGGSGAKPGAYFGVPLPICVLLFLACGLFIGLRFPGNRVAILLYTSGTYFPRAIVTFAVVIVFFLLAGSTAKLVLVHRQRARRLFGLILASYVALGAASLIFVAIWLPILTKLPFSVPGVPTPSLGQFLRQLAQTFSTLVSDQPLIQALVGGVAAGYASAAIPGLGAVSHGFIWASQATLWFFKKLLWYYPVMIGCLAIGIPVKFGVQGMAVYGQTIFGVAVVTVGLSACLIVLVKLTTRRTLRQIFSYYGSVWPTGFGTGGSYETLAMNVVSAEYDLGLRREIAEIAIVFGTVLNKSCATMATLLVTVTVARLLHIPISLSEILLLIPPVLILGLESPGIPGGAAFFMSPIVAALLHVRDVDVFVATFVTMYSGLIPMFTTAGNSTNDGLIGALLNDWFAGYLAAEESPRPEREPGREKAPLGTGEREPLWLRRVAGWTLLAPGLWMLVAPQALLGLRQLQWMHNGAFRGQAVLGVLAISVALYLVNAQSAAESAIAPLREQPAGSASRR